MSNTVNQVVFLGVIAVRTLSRSQNEKSRRIADRRRLDGWA
jgi:hypothetical protein